MRFGKFDYIFYIVVVLLLLILVITARAQTDEGAATENAVNSSSGGGTFVLEKSVIAGGGSQAAQSPLSLSGTGGQTVAGYKSSGANFSLYSGFWTPENFAPTATAVVVGGQVKTADDRGIQNATVTITFPSGEIRTARTSAFGYYRFIDIPTGETYIFTVSLKHFHFATTTYVQTILEENTGINFISD